jgi:hypothetical protein
VQCEDRGEENRRKAGGRMRSEAKKFCRPAKRSEAKKSCRAAKTKRKSPAREAKRSEAKRSRKPTNEKRSEVDFASGPSSKCIVVIDALPEKTAVQVGGPLFRYNSRGGYNSVTQRLEKTQLAEQAKVFLEICSAWKGQTKMWIHDSHNSNTTDFDGPLLYTLGSFHQAPISEFSIANVKITCALFWFASERQNLKKLAITKSDDAGYGDCS